MTPPDHHATKKRHFDVIILQLLSFIVVREVTLKENAVSKLSALSRHEALVLERRHLRAIGRSAVVKTRPFSNKPRKPGEEPKTDLPGVAAPARKLKEIGLRTV
jgi:hypothetical protein